MKNSKLALSKVTAAELAFGVTQSCSARDRKSLQIFLTIPQSMTV